MIFLLILGSEKSYFLRCGSYNTQRSVHYREKTGLQETDRFTDIACTEFRNTGIGHRLDPLLTINR